MCFLLQSIAIVRKCCVSSAQCSVVSVMWRVLCFFSIDFFALRVVYDVLARAYIKRYGHVIFSTTCNVMCSVWCVVFEVVCEVFTIHEKL